MAAARNKNGIFDAFTSKKVTYRRDVAGERRAMTAQAKKDKAEMRAWQINLLKELNFEMGQRHRQSGWKTPGRAHVTVAAKDILGAQKAHAAASASYRAGWRANPAEAKRARKMRNPETAAALDREIAAAEISESWHGRPAEVATDYIERLRYHDKLAELARLYELKVRVLGEGKPRWIRFDAKTKVGYTQADGRQQLHVVGGDQSLDLGGLGIPKDEANKDLVYVGPVVSITYDCIKVHLNERKPVKWEHQFGEEGGSEPVLIYDAMNQHILLAGGTYDIKLTDYDGKHSRGIVN